MTTILCRNAPKVAKGVRRVGRWAEETPEPDPRKARRHALGQEESQRRSYLPCLLHFFLPTPEKLQLQVKAKDNSSIF